MRETRDSLALIALALTFHLIVLELAKHLLIP